MYTITEIDRIARRFARAEHEHRHGVTLRVLYLRGARRHPPRLRTAQLRYWRASVDLSRACGGDETLADAAMQRAREYVYPYALHCRHSAEGRPRGDAGRRR